MLLAEIWRMAESDQTLRKAQPIEDPVKLAGYVFERFIKPKLDNPVKAFGTDVESAAEFYGDLANRFSFGDEEEWKGSTSMGEIQGKVESLMSGDNYDYGKMIRGIATGITLKDRAKQWNPVLNVPDFLEGEVARREQDTNIATEDYDRSIQAVNTTDNIDDAMKNGSSDDIIHQYVQNATGGKTTPSGKPLKAQEDKIKEKRSKTKTKPKAKGKTEAPSIPQEPERVRKPSPGKFLPPWASSTTTPAKKSKKNTSPPPKRQEKKAVKPSEKKKTKKTGKFLPPWLS